MAATLTRRPSARFTVSGGCLSRLAVEGELDAGAAVGFGAVAEWLEGTPEVVLDLSGCTHLDTAGRRTLFEVVRKLRDHGSHVVVVDPGETFAA